MKTSVIRIVIQLFLCLMTCVAFAQAQGRYTLGLGDFVSITVYDEADLSFAKVAINDNGRIPFPYLGEVDAKGKTIIELQDSIINGLRPDYLIDPKVTVSVVEYRPFFLTGQVVKPGSIPFQPGLTLRQAITLAGGFTERASSSRMNVISELEPGGNKASSVKVDLDYQIKPGDTVTIEESFF